LRAMNLTIVFTGDEEHPGEPLADARRALVEAAKHTDVALAFEAGNRADATVARRGASGWRVTASGRQAHSAGVFGDAAGYGAIYEVARILDAFRTQLGGEQYLTFNSAIIVGGTDVSYDTVAISGTAASKLNIIPSRTAISGSSLPSNCNAPVNACTISSRSICRAPMRRSSSATSIPRCRPRRATRGCSRSTTRPVKRWATVPLRRSIPDAAAPATSRSSRR